MCVCVCSCTICSTKHCLTCLYQLPGNEILSRCKALLRSLRHSLSCMVLDFVDGAAIRACPAGFVRLYSAGSRRKSAKLPANAQVRQQLQDTLDKLDPIVGVPGQQNKVSLYIFPWVIPHHQSPAFAGCLCSVQTPCTPPHSPPSSCKCQRHIDECL